MNSEDLSRVYDYAWGLKEGELKDSLLEVLDYADMSYVGRCEDIGKVCIENIGKIRNEVIDECEGAVLRIIGEYGGNEGLKERVKVSMDRLREE